MNYFLIAAIVSMVAFACPKKFSASPSPIGYIHSREHGVHLPPDGDAYAEWTLGAQARDWVRYNTGWHCWKPAPMYFVGRVEVSAGDRTFKIIDDSVACGCWVRPLTIVDFDFLSAVRSDLSGVGYIGDQSKFVNWYGPQSEEESSQNHAMDTEPRS